ncbi:MAG: hypothetical protein ACUVQ0_05760, partial [Thermoproteota archaeon]
VVEDEYGGDGISYLNVRRLDGKTYVEVGALVPSEISVSSIYRSAETVEERITRTVGGGDCGKGSYDT